MIAALKGYGKCLDQKTSDTMQESEGETQTNGRTASLSYDDRDALLGKLREWCKLILDLTSEVLSYENGRYDFPLTACRIQRL